MQRKFAFFLTAIMLSGSLTGLAEPFTGNGMIDGDINQRSGGITAQAAETEEGTAGDNQESNCIYNVLFPTNPKAYFDPENLSGKGQIFSDEFKVENYGNTDVAIRIKNIDVYYKSTEEVYELSEQEISDNHSDIKKINVDVIWKNKSENMEKVLNVSESVSDEYVLVLKAAEYDKNDGFVRLNKGSAGSFYFTGTLNANRDLVWEDGEVTVSFNYEIENIDEEALQEEEDEQEKPEELRKEDLTEDLVLHGLQETGREMDSQDSQDVNKDGEQPEQTDDGSGDHSESTDTSQDADQQENPGDESEPVGRDHLDEGQEAVQTETGRKAEMEEEIQ